MAKDYTSSLNLPKTEFSMKANLPQREPETLKYWESIDLYNKMVSVREGREKFTFRTSLPAFRFLTSSTFSAISNFLA
mgnify:CR=1 FL=1